MTIRRLPVLLALVLLVTGVPAIAEFYTDWLWFKELGYEQVFLRSLSAQTLVTVIAGLVVFALLAGNLLLALRVAAAAPVHDRHAAGAADDHDGSATHPSASRWAPPASCRC